MHMREDSFEIRMHMREDSFEIRMHMREDSFERSENVLKIKDFYARSNPSKRIFEKNAERRIRTLVDTKPMRPKRIPFDHSGIPAFRFCRTRTSFINVSAYNQTKE